jgi:hypothetical protein
MKINNSFWVLVFLTACQAPEKKEQTPSIPSFTSKEIGWTINIPADFKSMSENRVKAHEQKGKEAVEEATNQEVNTSSVIHLLNFQKNQFNSFNATLQPYDEKTSGSYVKSNELTKRAVYDAYSNQKIRVDTSSFEPTIAGQPFKGFSIKIYGPNGDVIMTQLMFSQLRKGYDFGVYINFNNEADQKVLLDALNHSKFSN